MARSFNLESVFSVDGPDSARFQYLWNLGTRFDPQETPSLLQRTFSMDGPDSARFQYLWNLGIRFDSQGTPSLLQRTFIRGGPDSARFQYLWNLGTRFDPQETPSLLQRTFSMDGPDSARFQYLWNLGIRFDPQQTRSLLRRTLDQYGPDSRQVSFLLALYSVDSLPSLVKSLDSPPSNNQRWTRLYESMVRHSTVVPVDQISELVKDSDRHLEDARRLCEENPGSTRLVAGELDDIERMLREATSYTQVNDEEWRAVMAAMKQEWIGTGHWYTCENGHPFAVGESGRPMQETKCPECGAPVGGQHHLEARGVRRAADLEERFGAMQL